jgi:hypothetical protein
MFLHVLYLIKFVDVIQGKEWMKKDKHHFQQPKVVDLCVSPSHRSVQALVVFANLLVRMSILSHTCFVGKGQNRP